jgi:hypothetical protein
MVKDFTMPTDFGLATHHLDESTEESMDEPAEERMETEEGTATVALVGGMSLRSCG